MKDPESNTPHELFDGGSRYLAPVYQRYYVWGAEELQSLLEDVVAASSELQQFEGALVLQDIGKRAGQKSPSEYLIIDGQQRLTTLYLLLVAIARLYANADKTDESERIIFDYLTRARGKYRGWPKLVPTAQDRAQLFGILEETFSDVDWRLDQDPPDTTSKRTAISRQWQLIMKELAEMFVKPDGTLAITALSDFEDKLLHHLEFVQVTLDENDDANAVFTKLNYEGVPLNLSDLVRNDVFSRFQGDAAAADKFYKSKWLPFEKRFGPKNAFDRYVPIYAFVKFKGKVSKTSAFPELQQSWHRKKPAAILAELSRYAEYFLQLDCMSKTRSYPRALMM